MNALRATAIRLVCAAWAVLPAGSLCAQSTDWFDAALLTGGGPVAFDSRRDRVVTFTGSYDVSRTWEWDGRSWTRRELALDPPTRTGHALCYDAGRGVTVLFGGQAQGTLLTDTWEFDGVEWIRRSTPHAPPWSDTFRMACDDARSRCVLIVGGLSPSTWEYDGNDWQQATPAAHPGPRTGAAVAFDAARGQVVMFGGYDANGGGQLAETWTWDGVNWSLMSPANAPPARTDASIAFDPGRGVVVLFGGREVFPIARTYFDTWEWNGVTWRRVAAATVPEVESGMTLVRDRSGVIGVPDALSPQATWAFDGLDWRAVEPPRSPSGRIQSAIAADDTRVVLFGGFDLALLDDTW